MSLDQAASFIASFLAFSIHHRDLSYFIQTENVPRLPVTRPTTVIMTRVWSVTQGEKSLSAFCLPARAGCLRCLTPPRARYFNAAISVVVPMFHSRHGITNRNREGQNICISAEWRELRPGLWLVRIIISRLLIGRQSYLSQPWQCLVVAIWLPMTLHCCQLFAKLNCHNLALGLYVQTPSANERRSRDGSSQ